jgi:hypothetical protein
MQAVSRLPHPQSTDLQNRGLQVRVLPVLWHEKPRKRGVFSRDRCTVEES